MIWCALLWRMNISIFDFSRKWTISFSILFDFSSTIIRIFQLIDKSTTYDLRVGEATLKCDFDHGLNWCVSIRLSAIRVKKESIRNQISISLGEANYPVQFQANPSNQAALTPTSTLLVPDANPNASVRGHALRWMLSAGGLKVGHSRPNLVPRKNHGGRSRWIQIGSTRCTCFGSNYVVPKPEELRPIFGFFGWFRWWKHVPEFRRTKSYFNFVWLLLPGNRYLKLAFRLGSRLSSGFRLPIFCPNPFTLLFFISPNLGYTKMFSTLFLSKQNTPV